MKITTAGKPMQGPWYCVFLAPKWKIRAFPMPAGNETVDHVTVWDEIVTSDIAPYYGIKDAGLIREIKNLPYSMPRGRVAETMPLRGQKQWAAYYGGDFKYGRNETLEILGQFDLLHQFSAGLVRLLPDDHEVMIREDFERLCALVKGTEGMRKKVVMPVEPEGETL